ncbi:class I SAM-dependent methyltransferase [Sulfuriferula nivalis]|uniref:SAM-dependent methyltransferase n=1 Tax=Sulfuriferula nivalis TaxID=2675298 RepID=A0A809RSS5_9PROT|nr:SAM-dependent methyltransferase [Sulfuriferula nivalis]BBP01931.1 SAM-dependent methyltransferase [Sulfuriferula nivalis]
MSLPVPTPEALSISQQLVQVINEEIQARGWISFARYMELALYAPGLGYYSAGAAKLGAAGDFVTAPEISPLFGRSLAQQVAQVLRVTGGDVLEVGAGSGRLACDILAELIRLECAPGHYYILEVSADLRERQQQLVAKELPDWINKVQWLSELPAAFTGCIIGNEVLDAMPVHIIHQIQHGLYERGVVSENQQFVWQDQPLTQGVLFDAATALALMPDYLTEINLSAQGFISSLGQCLQRGAIVMIDYGFGEGEYYHPQRNQGTLMCHYRQHAHPDPYYLPGLQDITAHVDFTAVGVAGIDAGLQLAGYTSQAQFLINCGITDLLALTSADDVAAYVPQVAAVQKLMSPAEMGELFKVMAWTRAMEMPLLGFTQGDQTRRL